MACRASFIAAPTSWRAAGLTTSVASRLAAGVGGSGGGGGRAAEGHRWASALSGARRATAAHLWSRAAGSSCTSGSASMTSYTSSSIGRMQQMTSLSAAARRRVSMALSGSLQGASRITGAGHGAAAGQPFSSAASSMPGVIDLVQALPHIPVERTRNFSIIAHIDHGKSTLSDKLLVLCKNIPPTTKGKEQVLDTLEVERQRGITVKAQTASMVYTHEGEQYLLNLIDTPGHVDFAYEVSRSLSACQGALLLVDCSQGVQAQTVANYHAALTANLRLVPVLTKIDLPAADPEPVIDAMQRLFKVNADEVLWTSARSGAGIDEVLPAVIKTIPPPSGNRKGPLRCLLFDSWFDDYRGVICVIRVIDGTIRPGMSISTAHSGGKYNVQEVGVLTPARVPVDSLTGGQVGYVILGMKASREAFIGDTFFETAAPVEPLPGFARAKPVVFSSVFPVDTDGFEEMYAAVEKLLLNDASVTVEKESSSSLGFGLRCGFLGLLHMDVFFERLQQEFDTPVISTAPMVSYKLVVKGEEMVVERPADFPPPFEVEKYFEPMIRASIIVPQEHYSAVIALLSERRSIQEEVVYMDDGRVVIKHQVPWAEVVTDFFDRLKSLTAGYANFDYEPCGFRETNLVKVDMLLNGKPLDALCFVAHRDKADFEARRVAEKLRSVIKRQQFEVIIQAAVGAKIMARERIPPFRKDVLTKGGKTVGGGDVTRKAKLLEKQKRGKKRMKTVGNIELPQAAFHSVMSRD